MKIIKHFATFILDLDRIIVGGAICLFALFTIFCILHICGGLDYQAEDWHEGTVINCNYKSYYSTHYAGNRFTGYGYVSDYDGTWQYLQVALDNGKILNTKWDYELYQFKYDLPCESRIRLCGYKRPLMKGIKYYKIERLE